MKFLLYGLMFSLSIIIIGCSSSSTSEKSGDTGKIITTPSGLQYEDINIGWGKTAVNGKKVTVNYIWKTEDGKLIEDTYKTGKPNVFELGSENILQGMNEGLLNMKEGGKRRLYIPPDLGYGARNIRNIPSNSKLIIEVELVKVD